MKSCPTCNRTFDDTFTFCLADGSLLSAPFDPQATLVLPEQKKTGPPPTEVLLPTGESKQEIPPTIASPAPEQQEELASTIAAPALKVTAQQPSTQTISKTPEQSDKDFKRAKVLIGVAVAAVFLFVWGYNLLNNRMLFSTESAGANTPMVNKTTNAPATSSVPSNSNQTRNAPPLASSQAAVTNLEDTTWEFLRDGRYKESFQFKLNGKVTRRFESDVRNGTWTRQGNKVSINIPGNRISLGFVIEGTIQGEEMSGQYIFGDQDSQSFTARRIRIP